MVATPYTLSLYLMYMPEDALEKTFFCVYDQIKEDITCKLPHVRTFYHVRNCGNKALWRFRFSSFFTYFFIHFTKIYAMDILDFAPQLIGLSKYTCIEDGSGNFTYGQTVDVFAPIKLPNTWWGLMRRLQHGPIYGKTLGTNRQCENRLITSPQDIESPLIKGKKYSLVNFNDVWNQASEKKRRNIRYVYDITDEMFAKVKRCKAILLTQPLQDDGMDEKDMLNLYDKYIKLYADKGVVLKPHPVESLDYGVIFPNAVYLKTRIPMQLLSVMGMRFEYAITPYSTAVSVFTNETKIIWIGSECNPLIAEKTELVKNAMNQSK